MTMWLWTTAVSFYIQWLWCFHILYEIALFLSQNKQHDGMKLKRPLTYNNETLKTFRGRGKGKGKDQGKGNGK